MKRVLDFIVIALLFCSCSGRKEASHHDSATDRQQDFIAMNDIAMTVRSINDALSVGDSLVSADYNFNGILTDGRGRPLYTLSDGTPGNWTVSVQREDSVVIRSDAGGDMNSSDLRSYINQALGLDADDLIGSGSERGEEFSDYAIPGGVLRFSSTEKLDAAGDSICSIEISLSRL